MTRNARRRGRRGSLLDQVWVAMSDGTWQTTAETRALVGRGGYLSIESRRRDLRRIGWKVFRRERRGCVGLSEYRLVLEPEA